MENKIVLLALLLEARQRGLTELTKTQIHKFMFISEQRLWKKRILSTGMQFIKMKQGPWSQDAENTLKQLEGAGLVKVHAVRTSSGDHAILTTLTQNGLELADSCVSKMTTSPASKIVESIRETIEKYGDVSSEDLQQQSHNMKNLVTMKRIHDIPLRQYVLRPRTLREAKEVFVPDEGCLETLEILIDSETRKGLERAIQGARERSLTVVASLDELED
ncbi:MAG: hypothetical protein ACTSV3_03485 [Candidatus Thorarchaeota archaeon]|nr:MAG: hypothetical protein DRP09_03685 [Candidatus Thorarchaeota archaeon]